MGADTGEANTHKQIIQQFDFLQRCTQETENDLRQLQQKQESLIIQYQEIQKVNGKDSITSRLISFSLHIPTQSSRMVHSHWQTKSDIEVNTNKITVILVVLV